MKRRLAAVLAADVVGYSRHMRVDEVGTLTTLNAHREKIINPNTERFNGRIVKLMGDGILMEFASAVDAVGFAVEMQNAVIAAIQDLPDEQKIVYRIGINVGDIILENGDIFGDGVNIAARLEGLAEPGGICVSGTVHDQVAGKLPQDLGYMGEKSLKNINEPVRVYAVALEQEMLQKETKPLGERTLEFDPPDRPAIAILPFQSLGSDPDKDYMADGFRFGISATLVQLSGLFLVHAPVLNGYRGKNVGAQSVGNELGVRYILEGAVQQAGNRIRVTVQLTDTEAKQTILAENFDRVLEDIFQLQDEITREIIYSLNIKLVANEVDRVWFGKLTHPDAIESYYRGASHFYELNKDDNAIARQMFEKLYQAQPESVVGPSYVAVTHWMDSFFEWTEPSSNSMEQAAEWAQKAMQYKENNGIGHAVYGHIKLVERKFDEALEICSKGTKLRSSCPLAHALLGLVLNFRGNAEGAIKSVKEALQLEKVYPVWLIDILAAAYRDSGEIDRSIPAAIESIRLNPNNNDARLILCSDYIYKGNREAAKKVADEIIAGNPDFSLSTYEKNLPYQNPAVLDKLIGALRDAGLPD